MATPMVGKTPETGASTRPAGPTGAATAYRSDGRIDQRRIDAERRCHIRRLHGAAGDQAKPPYSASRKDRSRARDGPAMENSV